MSEPTPAQEENKANKKRDLEVINEVMAQHPGMVSILQRRLDQVKVIMHWWNKGSVTSAINALSMQPNDLAVANDVLNATFAKNQRLDLLNYDNIAAIVPHATNLVNSKYETHILCGLICRIHGLGSALTAKYSRNPGAQAKAEFRLRQADRIPASS